MRKERIEAIRSQLTKIKSELCADCGMCCKIFTLQVAAPQGDDLKKMKGLLDAWGLKYKILGALNERLRFAIPIPCQHYKAGIGCTIYVDRPQICREYVCTNANTPFPKSPWNIVWRPEEHKEEETHDDAKH